MHRRAGRETRDAKIVGLREQGMTLAKIAEAVGVSDETVRRATASTNVEGRVAGRDGKEYPAHYAPRTRAALTPEDVSRIARQALRGRIERYPHTTLGTVAAGLRQLADSADAYRTKQDANL
jgi:transposase